MRFKLFPLFVVIFVCVISDAAQTVVESESSVVINEKSVSVSLVVDSKAPSSRRIALDILDSDGIVRTNLDQITKLRSGRQTLSLSMPIGDLLKKSDDEVAWFRLRYSVGDTTGIVSLSEMLKGDFDLRAAAFEQVVTGEIFRVRVRALHPFTKSAVKGVSVKADLGFDLDTESEDDKLNLNASARTNGEGFAILDFKIPPNLKLDSDGELNITGTKNGIVRKIEEDLDSRENEGNVLLTTDKPLYQPGQKFSVRALYFDAANTVVSGSEIKFLIKDEEGTVVYTETEKTSDFGIASISWQIPDNAKLGSYRVVIDTDDSIKDDELYFKVLRYDLPSFSVVAKTDKTFYLPTDDQAKITVRADYLFGKPVPNGKIRVVQENDRHWSWSEQRYIVEEKGTISGEGGAEGTYVANVDLREENARLRSDQWERFRDIPFTAYVTDPTTNRTEQKRFELRLTKEPVHIYLIRYSNQHPALPILGYVSTFYADGTPAACNVEIKNRNLVAAKVKTNSLGAGKFEFEIPRDRIHESRFEIQATAIDRKGQKGTFEESYYLDHDDQIQLRTQQAIYKPGEAIDVDMVSTQEKGFIYLDVVKDWIPIDSYVVRLRNGKATVQIPYKTDFQGALVLAAYTDRTEGYYDDSMRASRGIIFPEQQNLILNAKFSKAEYRPNEDATVKFSVADGAGKSIESALGIGIFDKAIEERARTETEFGGYFSRFYRMMGYERSFGNLTLKDINALDMSKPVAPEMQLAAEIMLADNYYYPHIYHSGNLDTEAKTVYSDYFPKRLKPFEMVLDAQFKKNYDYPTDETSLKRIVAANGMNLDLLLDPWGQKYYTAFSIDKTKQQLILKTTGPDKKIGTNDDFIVSSTSFDYFAKTGDQIDKVSKDYHERAGGFIRDLLTLQSELAKAGFGPEALKDHWGRDYKITFDVEGRNFLIRIHSFGPNGIYEPVGWQSDDFDIWTSYTDYFYRVENQINQILSDEINVKKTAFPLNADTFKKLLKDNGLDLDKVTDGYGNPVYLTTEYQSRYTDKTIVENSKTKITPVTDVLKVFKVRTTSGTDNDQRDDRDLATFSGVVTEQYNATGFAKTEVNTIVFSGAMGAIRGRVLDQQGAVIPNATVTATNANDDAKVYTAVSDSEGIFLIGNLPSGRYNVKTVAPAFKASVSAGIEVRSQTAVEMKITLEVGSVSAVVEVRAVEALSVVNTSSASISKTVTSAKTQIVFPYKDQNSTPRLREYFPETLVWQPELLTDKRGKAELNFKTADNITTWKMFAIASTKKGKIGVAEKEVTAFQPFFVDLDPPKFLTEGDEIYLPSQVRNYTDKQQKVDVMMDKADWFSMLASGKQQIDVKAGDSQNAVFGFKAETPIKDGKQRVTAIAQSDSDAIEKPVTVRPNGQEVVHTDSNLFTGEEKLDLNLPANALPKTQKAELKIYPNLHSHIAESVEGLLERPYGCGEQTISSTYPNLMVLRFAKPDSALASKAKRYLQKGYERLLGYQGSDGGFTYWGGKSSSDTALTAYAIRFLNDVGTKIDVNTGVIKRAEDWLIKQQRADGSWLSKHYWQSNEDPSTAKLTTTYVARSLAMRKNSDINALTKALTYLKTKNAEIDEPYALALFGLASLDAGDSETAASIAKSLESMAIPEGSSVYWKLETNTPFYGWGTAGRIETTALVTQLLIRTNQKDPNAQRQDLINKATLFLLKNKDRYGVWYSTQTTINVLDAFIAAIGTQNSMEPQRLDVIVNGEPLKTVDVAPDRVEAVTLDLTGKVNPSNNTIEIRSSGNFPVMSQLVASHYIDWKDSDASNTNVNQSRALSLNYRCDKTNAAIMEEVNCSVKAERIGFKGYGMLLAEIGTPPGADISRDSLEKAIESDWSISHYEILPDRIVVYMWSKAGGTNFNFKFHPRYGINAQTPASIVYDYYNPEAQATVAPLRFVVK